MTTYTWIKLYTEILDDPKMGRLEDHRWRTAIEIFLLAGRTGKNGELPTVDDMCWALRFDRQKLIEELSALSELGILQEAQPGIWAVTHFEKRQAPMSPNERQQRHRSGNAVSRECHKVVTEEEVEEEEESTTATTTAKPSKKPNVFEFYSSNFGALTSFTSDILKDMEDTYTSEWVIAALSEAVASEARNLKYAEAILKRWRTEGFQSKKQKQVPATPARGNGTKQSAAQAIDELANWAAEKERLNVQPF
jgi:DnaD/phage-associated family protein